MRVRATLIHPHFKSGWKKRRSEIGFTAGRDQFRGSLRIRFANSTRRQSGAVSARRSSSTAQSVERIRSEPGTGHGGGKADLDRLFFHPLLKCDEFKVARTSSSSAPSMLATARLSAGSAFAPPVKAKSTETIGTRRLAHQPGLDPARADDRLDLAFGRGGGRKGNRAGRNECCEKICSRLLLPRALRFRGRDSRSPHGARRESAALRSRTCSAVTALSRFGRA